MKSLNVNNPIIYFPASNFESKEFKLQEKINHLAKINLSKLSKEFLNSCIADINQNRIKFIKK